jgi:hypothetical protein
MLNLSTPSTLLQIATGSAVASIAVHASYVDLSPFATVPAAINTLITTATTTTVVPAPADGTDRNVKFLSIRNTSGAACQVAVQITDGSLVVSLFNINLLPGYLIQYDGDGDGFVVYDNLGNRLATGAGVAAIMAISAGTQIATSGTVVFSNSNNVTFGMSGGSVVTASAGGAGGPASINLSAGTTSNLSSAFTFANANGVSFGLNDGTITASVATVGSSLTAINVSAGTTSNNLSALTFANGSGVSFGLNGSVVTASIASSLSAINISAGTTSNNLSAVTFSNSNGVSFGLNGSTITGSVAGTVGTISCFSQDADFVTGFTAAQASLSLQKVSLPMNLLATQLAIIANFAGASGSSGAVTISHGCYTLSGGTASLASSASRVISWTSGSATTASSLFGGVSGTRYRTVSCSYAMTPGDYLFGWALQTSGGVTAAVFGRAGLNLVGSFDGIETAYFLDGLSTSSVAALPGSIAASDTGYVRTGFSALLQPGAIFVGTH